MSLRRSILPTFNAVAKGGTAVCNLELGKRYHVIWLELADDGTASSGNTAAPNTSLDNFITQIRLKVNGKVQRTMKASELNYLNSLNNTPGGPTSYSVKTSGSAGASSYRMYLPIFLAEPWRKNGVDAAAMAWNAQGIASFQIEVDIGSGTIGSSPALTGFYEWEPATAAMTMICKWIRQSFAVVGTAEDITTIDRKDFLQSISLFAGSDNSYVSKLRFTANNQIIQDLLGYAENQATLLGREMSPDTGGTYPRYDLVFDYDDPVNGAFNANGLNEMTLHLEFNTTAAGTMVAIIQRTGAAE